MRFFTDHFFSEEQKAELLGDRYGPARRMSGLVRDAAQSRTVEAMQTREWLQREQDEFDRRARRVELLALPLVVLISLAFGLSVSYLLDVF